MAMTVSQAAAKAGGAASGIAALGDGAGVVERALACQGEGHDGIAAEADAGGLAVETDALRPAACQAASVAGPDEQAEAESAAAVAVAARGSDGSDEGSGEHVGTVHGGILLLVVVRSRNEMECAALTRSGPKTL